MIFWFISLFFWGLKKGILKNLGVGGMEYYIFVKINIKTIIINIQEKKTKGIFKYECKEKGF